ncbi:hypothetical protein P4O66_011479 [Electrophorus voltai]|uniref:Uncharacterized protein n=1 Tax=Electrophorus voltai TaxID=2609070 RepID=A0AAD9DUC2_9TELE|nr:hypothetical protein P4O66_011479 [Electrophorus voltai]
MYGVCGIFMELKDIDEILSSSKFTYESVLPGISCTLLVVLTVFSQKKSASGNKVRTVKKTNKSEVHFLPDFPQGKFCQP